MARRRRGPVTLLLIGLVAVGCGPGPREVFDADMTPDGPFDAPPPPDAPPDAMPVNCGNLPTGPVPYQVLGGFVASEDLAFDVDGNVIESDTQNLYKTKRNLNRATWVVNFPFRAGMRMTPTHKLVVNSDYTNSIVRVDPDGSRHTLMSNVAYPNGMEVDPQGFVYVAAQSENTVYRINPETAEYTVITQQINAPNGLTFNRDYSTLYIGAFSGEGVIYAVDIAPDGTPANFRPWKTNVGTGLLDGMAVDACNNVYIADYGQSEILRINGDGTNMITIIDGNGAYMPNFDWGRGFGGWRTDRLYVVSVNQGLFEVDLGVESKPRW
jgi:DNA-binding beta-propeller fold protein YncE